VPKQGERKKALREAGGIKVRTSALQRTPRTLPALHSDSERIVELFARRQPVYGTAEVVQLLGISEAQLLDAIATGSVGTEASETGAQVIPWEDVANLALEEWTPRMIAAALGHDAEDVLPPLNQHRLIQVSLPLYLIRLLDQLARIESATRHVPRNASDIIERRPARPRKHAEHHSDRHRNPRLRASTHVSLLHAATDRPPLAAVPVLRHQHQRASPRSLPHLRDPPRTQGTPRGVRTP